MKWTNSHVPLALLAVLRATSIYAAAPMIKGLEKFDTLLIKERPEQASTEVIAHRPSKTVSDVFPRYEPGELRDPRPLPIISNFESKIDKLGPYVGADGHIRLDFDKVTTMLNNREFQSGLRRPSDHRPFDFKAVRHVRELSATPTHGTRKLVLEPLPGYTGPHQLQPDDLKLDLQPLYNIKTLGPKPYVRGDLLYQWGSVFEKEDGVVLPSMRREAILLGPNDIYSSQHALALRLHWSNDGKYETTTYHQPIDEVTQSAVRNLRKHYVWQVFNILMDLEKFKNEQFNIRHEMDRIWGEHKPYPAQTRFSDELYHNGGPSMNAPRPGDPPGSGTNHYHGFNHEVGRGPSYW